MKTWIFIAFTLGEHQIGLHKILGKRWMRRNLKCILSFFADNSAFTISFVEYHITFITASCLLAIWTFQIQSCYINRRKYFWVSFSRFFESEYIFNFSSAVSAFDFGIDFVARFPTSFNMKYICCKFVAYVINRIILYCYTYKYLAISTQVR